MDPILLGVVPGGIIPGFDENTPLRDEAVRIDTVPGASAIQVVLDNTEWASMSANPVAYAAPEWVVNSGLVDFPEVFEALDLLLKDHTANKNLGLVCRRAVVYRRPKNAPRFGTGTSYPFGVFSLGSPLS